MSGIVHFFFLLWEQLDGLEEFYRQDCTFSLFAATVILAGTLGYVLRSHLRRT